MRRDIKILLGSLAVLGAAVVVSFLLLRHGRKEHTEAHYLCLKCGHGQARSYDGHELASTLPEGIDSLFSQRFGSTLPPDHAHDWMAYGCIIGDRGNANVGDAAQEWIEILPRLADSAGSEALFREAIELTPEQRRELIYSFLRSTHESGVGYDEAFARWSARRRK